MESKSAALASKKLAKVGSMGAAGVGEKLTKVMHVLTWLLGLLLTGLLVQYGLGGPLHAGVDWLVGENLTSEHIFRLHYHVKYLPSACNVPVVGDIVCPGRNRPQ